jgi:hypothetical protein|tara:strand:- start:962 stop:1063 length:102 start_codon:yes stop_codon:yes gene_type:complete
VKAFLADLADALALIVLAVVVIFGLPILKILIN